MLTAGDQKLEADVREGRLMRLRSRIALMVAIAGLLFAGSVATAGAAEFGKDFGIVDGSFSATLDGPLADQAGAEADFTTAFKITQVDPNNPMSLTTGTIRNLEVELPPGLVANPTHWEECPFSMVQPATGMPRCPIETAVGQIRYKMVNTHTGIVLPAFLASRVYRVNTQPGEAAAFGFVVFGNPVRLHAKVDPANGHRIRAVGRLLNEGQPLAEAQLTLWGVPEDRQGELSIPDGGISQPGAGTFGGPLPVEVPRHRFVSAPTRCDGSFETKMTLTSWQSPVPIAPLFATNPAVSGCDQLDFQPSLAVTSATVVADQPSAYEVELTVPQNEDPYGLATPNLKDAVVTLPAGVAISPGQADGLKACSDAQFGAAKAGPDNCPLASKIAAVNIDTPLLDTDLEGSLFVGTQKSQDPESGEMYRLLLAAEGPGSQIKLEGSVKADRSTGRLTATFTENPQLPFSKMTLSFKGGSRAVLANPDTCGQFATNYQLSSWSGQVADGESAPFAVAEGCRDGFSPKLAAGTTEAAAAASSPFSLTVARSDGDKEMESLKSIQLPEGLLGRVASVPLCGDAQASAGTCPDASRIGSVQVAAGSGSNPLWVPQPGKSPTSVSLTGPYNGAPYGLSIVVPAQAGPFDLGTVVVRSGLHVDERTTQLSTGVDETRIYNSDGSLARVISGAMPTILKGIPLNMRELRVVVDRENFMVNPTDCSVKQVTAQAVSIDDDTADLGNPFTAVNCAALDFAPRFGAKILNKSRRSTLRSFNPAVRFVVAPRSGHANIGRAAVTLPPSVILDQSHIRTVCTRAQFAERNCPEASIYGYAKAWSPLLNRPVRGPVYLGSSSNQLPDLIADLEGEVRIVLQGRIDTAKGGRIRNTFDMVPDAPVSRFVLQMRGGERGILVNSTDLCRSNTRAVANFTGQNGKRSLTRPRVQTGYRGCGKVRRKAARKRVARRLANQGVAYKKAHQAAARIVARKVARS